MIYMRSVSGNDGSYNLTVSFQLGTNPDVNTVNVLNRVQTANAELPATVQAEGLTVQKRSSANPDVHQLLQPDGQVPAVVHRQLHDDQHHRRHLAHTRRRPGQPAEPAEILDADLVRHHAPDQSRPVADRHHQRHRAAEHGGRGRPHRRPAGRPRSAVPVQRPDPGAAGHARHSSATSSSVPTRTARCCICATWRGSNWARRRSIPSPGSTASHRWHWRSIWPLAPTRSIPPPR